MEGGVVATWLSVGCLDLEVSWRGLEREEPGLVNIQKAIDNGHRNSEFSHEKW